MIIVISIVQILLVTLVIVNALVLCVMYARVSELTRLASVGGGAHRLLGFEVPRFEAVDANTGKVINFCKKKTNRLCLLIVSSGCQLCQKLLNALRDETTEIIEDAKDLEFVVYCQGSVRGARSLLMGIESRIVTLVSHDTDLTTVLPISSVPALLTTDTTGSVVRHTYPFSIHDILTVISNREEEPSTRSI
ncbi:MAG: hypothetical protein F4W92_00785 [Gammaproteobacteria bacterium]|nr:hypothetical protein [Gammaproteobacteria bacterium]